MPWQQWLPKSWLRISKHMLDDIVEIVLEAAGELISEGIEAVAAGKKKNKAKSQEEKTDVSEELNH